MWDVIRKEFEGYPAQEKVARLLLEHGLCVKDGSVLCGRIEQSYTALAKASGTNRRAVKATISTIEKSKFLAPIFSGLLSTCSFKNIATRMKWGMVEILPRDVTSPGIIAKVTGIIAEEGISIRQIIADDPNLNEDPKAFIITERPIPPRLLPKIKSVPGVQAVVIH